TRNQIVEDIGLSYTALGNWMRQLTTLERIEFKTIWKIYRKTRSYDKNIKDTILDYFQNHYENKKGAPFLAELIFILDNFLSEPLTLPELSLLAKKDNKLRNLLLYNEFYASSFIKILINVLLLNEGDLKLKPSKSLEKLKDRVERLVYRSLRKKYEVDFDKNKQRQFNLVVRSMALISRKRRTDPQVVLRGKDKYVIPLKKMWFKDAQDNKKRKNFFQKWDSFIKNGLSERRAAVFVKWAKRRLGSSFNDIHTRYDRSYRTKLLFLRGVLNIKLAKFKTLKNNDDRDILLEKIMNIRKMIRELDPSQKIFRKYHVYYGLLYPIQRIELMLMTLGFDASTEDKFLKDDDTIVRHHIFYIQLEYLIFKEFKRGLSIRQAALVGGDRNSHRNFHNKLGTDSYKARWLESRMMNLYKLIMLPSPENGFDGFNSAAWLKSEGVSKLFAFLTEQRTIDEYANEKEAREQKEKLKELLGEFARRWNLFKENPVKFLEENYKKDYDKFKKHISVYSKYLNDIEHCENPDFWYWYLKEVRPQRLKYLPFINELFESAEKGYFDQYD
ncbi:MAG: hypothetical protein ACTSRI_20545, partial [Promethearchaeota archaeon]